MPPSRGEYGVPLATRNFYIMRTKNKAIIFRVSEAEYNKIKELAGGYKSASMFLRTAIGQFSDRQARQRFELMDALFTIHREHDARLAWCGSNLNQAVHKLHLLDIEGIMPRDFLDNVLMPAITETLSAVTAFRDSLDRVTQQSLKI